MTSKEINEYFQNNFELLKKKYVKNADIINHRSASSEDVFMSRIELILNELQSIDAACADVYVKNMLKNISIHNKKNIRYEYIEQYHQPDSDVDVAVNELVIDLSKIFKK